MIFDKLVYILNVLYVVLCCHHGAFGKSNQSNSTSEAQFITCDGTKYLTIDDIQKSLVLEYQSTDKKTHNEIYLKKNAVIEFCAGQEYIVYNNTKIFLSKNILYKDISTSVVSKSKQSNNKKLLVTFDDYNEILVPLLVPNLVKIQQNQKTVQRIVIDAGHGGKDDGASNKTYGLKEKNLALQVALALQKKLTSITSGQKNKQTGNKYIVELTRAKDEFLGLQQRTQKANSANADLFICIHFNSAANQSAEGIEVLTYPRTSKKGKNIKPCNKNDILNLIAGYSFCSALCQSLQEVNRGVKMQELGVLSDLNCPGILLECGFLSNDATAKKFIQTSTNNSKNNKNVSVQNYILNTTYINNIVDAIVAGLDKYCTNLSFYQ